jgi:putative membrane protein
MSPSDIEGSRLLAANQGVYNGAVAMTWLWGLSSGNDAAVLAMLVFVVVVGVFGGVTVSILVVQALPAVLALILRLLA